MAVRRWALLCGLGYNDRENGGEPDAPAGIKSQRHPWGCAAISVAKTYSKTITLSASLVFGMLGVGVIPGLVKSFETTYGLSHTSMGFLLALCGISATVFGILFGSTADRLGIRRVLVVTIALTAFSAMTIWLLEDRLVLS